MTEAATSRENGKGIVRLTEEQATGHISRLQTDLEAYRSALLYKNLLIQQLEQHVTDLQVRYKEALDQIEEAEKVR